MCAQFSRTKRSLQATKSGVSFKGAVVRREDTFFKSQSRFMFFYGTEFSYHAVKQRVLPECVNVFTAMGFGTGSERVVVTELCECKSVKPGVSRISQCLHGNGFRDGIPPSTKELLWLQRVSRLQRVSLSHYIEFVGVYSVPRKRMTINY